jgi:hypothetical protein
LRSPIRAAERYDDTNHFAITHSGAVANDGVADFFFHVPIAAFAWDTELTSPSDSAELAWSIADPAAPFFTVGSPVPPVGALFDVSTGCWVPSTSVNCTSAGVARVFEYSISTALQSAATPFTLETDVRGRVAVGPSPVVIDPASTGTTYDRTVNFAAGAIGFEGEAHGSDLGPLPTSTEWVDIPDPQPGRWIAIIDPASVPSGSSEFDYAQVATAPAYGSVTVDDTRAAHPAFDHWARAIHVTPLQAPAGAGPLRGYVRTTGGVDRRRRAQNLWPHAV